VNPLVFASRAVRYWKRNGRYWSCSKAANALLAHVAMRLKLRYVPAWPVVAKIEATNICNGTCRLCPVGRKEPGHRPFGMIGWELYCRLIEGVKSTLHAIDLTNWGESLLHPRIMEMIRYAHEARIYTYLSTNMHTVRPEHVEGLARSGLDELSLSLHGLSQETYAAYQPGFDFAQACETIGQLVAASERLGPTGKMMKIKLNFVVTAVNEHEVSALPDFAKRYGVEYLLSEPSLNLRFEVSPEMALRRPNRAREIIAEAVETWLPRKGRYDRPLYRRVLDDPRLMFSPKKVVTCDWPWMKLVVNWDGRATICCGSYDLADDVGCYTGQPIKQLWNSLPYRLCRATFGNSTNGKNEKKVLCGRCPGLLL